MKNFVLVFTSILAFVLMAKVFGLSDSDLSGHIPFCQLKQIHIISKGVTNAGMSKTQSTYLFENASKVACRLTAQQEVVGVTDKNQKASIHVSTKSYFLSTQKITASNLILKPGGRAKLHINGVDCGVLAKTQTYQGKISKIIFKIEGESVAKPYDGYGCELTSNYLTERK